VALATGVADVSTLRRSPSSWRCASGMRFGAESAHDVPSGGPVYDWEKLWIFKVCGRLAQVWVVNAAPLRTDIPMRNIRDFDKP
jgi:hypothetical protein